MFAITVVLVLFFIFPAVLGGVGNVWCTPEKRTKYYLWVQAVKSWTATEHSLAAFIVLTVLLYVAGFLTLAGVRLGVVVYFLLMLLVTVSAFVYLCCYWGVSTSLKKHAGLINRLIGVLAIGVATISKIYSDAAIAELTGLSPQSLPGAQLLLTFILTPAIWFIGLSLFLGYLSFPVIVFLFFRSMYIDFVGVKSFHDKRPSLPGVTALLAVALFALITLALTEKIASKSFYENRLKQAIAFASFNLPSTYCGLPDVKGVGVAAMSDDRAAVALPSKNGSYSFEVVSCKRNIKSANDIGSILEIINSSQKQ